MQDTLVDLFKPTRLSRFEVLTPQRLTQDVNEYCRLYHDDVIEYSYADITMNRQFDGPTDVARLLVSDAFDLLPDVLTQVIDPGAKLYLSRPNWFDRAAKLFVQVWHHTRRAEYDAGVSYGHPEGVIGDAPSLEVTSESCLEAMQEFVRLLGRSNN